MNEIKSTLEASEETLFNIDWLRENVEDVERFSDEGSRGLIVNLTQGIKVRYWAAICDFVLRFSVDVDGVNLLYAHPMTEKKVELFQYLNKLVYQQNKRDSERHWNTMRRTVEGLAEDVDAL